MTSDPLQHPARPPDHPVTFSSLIKRGALSPIFPRSESPRGLRKRGLSWEEKWEWLRRWRILLMDGGWLQYSEGGRGEPKLRKGETEEKGQMKKKPMRN